MTTHPGRRGFARLLASAALICGIWLQTACTHQTHAPAAPPTIHTSTTLPDHPRLIATTPDWQTLAQRRATDPDLNRLVELLLERARTDLKRDPVERKLEGRRLLGVSREFIRRSLLWSFAYRVTSDRVFLDRARREMLAMSAFPDWNPSHYLDVAEMTAGLALSYDWLYHDLSSEDRHTIRRAIIDKGIAQARQGHKTFTMTHNWGQVCIGGMVLGALAVEEDEPALAADLLAAAKKNAFTALDAYKPDGVYPEGPGYWSYGTTYETLLIAALRSSLNTDWNLLEAPGLKRSAEFFAHAVGPTGKQHNFADAGEGQDIAPPLFYLARELQQPALIDAKRQMIRNKQGLSERYAPLIALWWPGPAKAQPVPLHFSGQGPQPVAIWRSSWTDPNALYFAIKGGGAAHNHAHMDGGSFILDLDGVRWAKDLGMQDYNSLESRGIDLWNMKQASPRWQVFRLGNAAHNTLSIDDSLHNAAGMATLRMQGSQEAQLDLTPLFLPGQLSQATRTARVEGSLVSLSDAISGARPGSEIRWAMNTEAAITLDGSTATLRQAGKTLHVRFTGTPLTLEVIDISKPRADFDAANPNTRQLVARTRAGADGSGRLNVHFSRD
ncbi:heparinase II/III family protein [Uliginosibacterium sp. 31-16]|uniref:heparinase II/III domain-containing protein n=1 Tax=Uliginosibacterium sp. 31-16 TaxID=3068315 RepID=UPI00273ED8C2|nr:heparinase II/III family protein [Uliginosibacterium sp. 31-16]MDP5241038.1 heparinase II/III family protein [Uliginosibacterium sp. 31-16]